jgi:molybdopterin-containing oxidoreductase family iron-sulfur binding subunit
VNRDHAHAGAVLAFGERVDAVHHLEKADIIVALDADLFAPGGGSLRHIREFARRRRVQETNGTMNRLYVVEAAPTVTGSNADERLPLRPSEVESFVRALAAALGLPVTAPASMQAHQRWIDALAADLKRHRSRSLIVAGETQSPNVHALVCFLNQALGNVGETVRYIEPLDAEPVAQLESLQDLVSDMEAGKVNFLLILGGNPVYKAPADLRFAERLDKVATRVHLGLYDDETSRLCHWHLPQAHELETWGDACAYDGTLSIQQPLIAPLYEGKSPLEVLAAFSAKPSRTAYEIVRDHWKTVWTGADFESRWRRALHDGLVAGSAAEPKPVTVRNAVVEGLRPMPAAAAALEIAIRPDPTVYDGRFANNGWLQELPKPISKLTWDNAAYISPATAERLGLHNEEVVELKVLDRSVEAPVWIIPGHAADVVTVHLGYGRRHAGRVGTGAGFDAYVLRTAAAPWGGSNLELRRTGKRLALSCTQDHFSLEGRDIVRTGTLEEYKKDPHLAPHGHHAPEPMSLYGGFEYPNNAWGLAIDLNACVGCNACTIACQSENNIPVVGKVEVARGREMHWIRIDRYFEGALDNPTVVYQPLPCQHCENAPCELVCPVNATVHSAEGLNDMVYNRCVGTKYCSNNCPYKVRRFNFFRYSDWETESLKPMRNPDVTVRSRGVMEKCTYCVQRINASRIQAKREGRAIRDGEIVTACQQVCPAEAIVFGNINDKDSRIAKLRSEPRHYQLLGELNTRPRTTYLAGIRNPNPQLAAGRGEA